MKTDNPVRRGTRQACRPEATAQAQRCLGHADHLQNAHAVRDLALFNLAMRSRGLMSAAVIFRDFSATRTHFPERVILHRLAGGRRQKGPFALTRQLRSCVVVLPQDVERERFEGNSASDPRTALLHRHVRPDAVDIKIGKAEVTAFGGGDTGAQKGRNNGCVAKRFEVCVRPRYAGRLQATIIVKRKVDRCGFVLGPRLLKRAFEPRG